MNILVIGDPVGIYTGISKSVSALSDLLESQEHNVIHLAKGISRSSKTMELVKGLDKTTYSTRFTSQNGYSLIMKMDHKKDEVLTILNGEMLAPIPELKETSMNADIEDNLGLRVIQGIVNYENIDLIIICDDLWHLNEYSYIIKKMNVPTIGWTMIDTEKLYFKTKFLDCYQQVWVFDDKGKDLLIHNGCSTDIKVVPFPVDTDIYHPIEDEIERLSMRHEINVPLDAFLILAVGRNIRRKNLHSLVKAMKVIKEKVNDEKRPIYLAIKTTNEGYSWTDDVKEWGIQDRVITLNDPIGRGITEEHMNRLYNCADLQVLMTSGEGFCLRGDMGVMTRNGYQLIRDLEVGEEVIAHDGTNKVLGKKKVTNTKKHVVLETENGEIITATPEHLLLVMYKNIVRYMSLQDIAEEYDKVQLVTPSYTTISNSFKNKVRHSFNKFRKLFGVVSYQKNTSAKNLYTDDDVRLLGRALVYGKIITPRNKTSRLVVRGEKINGRKINKLTNLFWTKITNTYTKMNAEIFALSDKQMKILFDSVKAALPEIFDKELPIRKIYELSYLSKLVGYKVRMEKTTMYRGKIVEDSSIKINNYKDNLLVGIKKCELIDKPSRMTFYSIVVSGNHLLNVYNYPITNCVPLAEGLSAGLMCITSKYSAPSSWGSEILYLIDPVGDYIDTNLGVERAILNIDDVVDMILKVYNKDIKPITNVRNRIVENHSKIVFNSKVVNIINELESGVDKDIKIDCKKVMMVRPSDEYYESIVSSNLITSPDIIVSGVSEDNNTLLTTSISIIYNGYKDKLEDDEIYTIYDPRFNLNKRILSQMVVEYHQDSSKVLFSDIKGNEQSKAIFGVDDKSRSIQTATKEGQYKEYILMGIMIGTGSQIKNLKLTDYMTDGYLFFKYDESAMKLSSYSLDLISLANDPILSIDFGGILCNTLQYKCKLVIPSVDGYNMMRMSNRVTGAVMNLASPLYGSKVIISNLYKWVYPECGIQITNLEVLGSFCEQNQLSYVFIPDALPLTLDVKLGGRYSQNSPINQVSYIAMVDDSGEYDGHPSGSTVVSCKTISSLVPKVQYIVGLPPSQLREIFPTARINLNKGQVSK